jgi:hypothetical protein
MKSGLLLTIAVCALVVTANLYETEEFSLRKVLLQTNPAAPAELEISWKWRDDEV